MIQDILANNENIHINDKQIAILKEHFPSCFSGDGTFDIVRFQEEIKEKTEITHEGYELRFLGKSYAKLLASTDTTTVIVPNEEHNNLPENKESENLYISGDNLDGLKHLLNSYQKQIKCIYIDPPYNTGTDGFVYNDSFDYTVEELQDKLSIDETQAKRILDLSRRGSASHSAWLMFMYPRLLLARDLLKDDGVIFISIDENEQANLKLLCDDIFGEENFISDLIWQKKKGGGNDASFIATEHETIIFFARSKSALDKLFQGYSEDYAKRYKEEDDTGKFFWDTFKRKSGKQYYKIPCPDGSFLEEDEFGNKISWLRSEKRFYDDLKKGEVRLIKYEDRWSVQFKQRMPQGKKPRSLITDNGTTSDGSDELFSYFKKNVFQNPKPSSLIMSLLNYGTNGGEDIVLDFFSGSGSTADAVMQLNTINETALKFISVQLPAILKEDDISQKIAYDFLIDNNLPTTLDYIGIERIKRAAAKIKEENPDKVLGLGFKHYILQEPNQNTLDKCETFDKAALISDTTILDDFGPETVLTTWLNNDGYGLTANAEEIDLAGYKAYYKDKHLYLIYPDFTQKALEALLSKYDADGAFNPENIILFGYSFSEWSVTEMLEKNLKILNDSEKNLKINYAVRY